MFDQSILKKYHRRGRAFRLCQFLVLALSCSLCLYSNAEDKEEVSRKIAIITHPDNANSEVSRAELGRMFMKKTTIWRDGHRCIPIDQAGSSEVRAQFYRAVLDRSVDSMKRYWMRETMTGNAKPPVSLDSSSTVKKYVQKIQGGIAYIYEDEVNDSVKVLHVTDLPEFLSPDAGDDDASDDDSASGDTP